jgi:formylglycine-generating enzyme required for sulfatase activity
MLGTLTKLPFDLPTEAQWEYAARSGGKRMLFATDNGNIERGRNFSKEWQYGEKEPSFPEVGSYPP